MSTQIVHFSASVDSFLSFISLSFFLFEASTQSNMNIYE